MGSQPHPLFVAQRFFQRHRSRQQLAEFVLQERRHLDADRAVKNQHGAVGQPFDRDRIDGVVQRKTVRELAARPEHGVAADGPEGRQLGRLEHIQHRRLGHDLEAAVEAPVDTVGTVQHPESAFGRNCHVERHKRHAGRKAQLRRLAAGMQIKDQQAAGREVSDDEIVMLSHDHAGQFDALRRQRRCRAELIEERRGRLDRHLPIHRRPHVAGRLPVDALTVLADPPDIAEPVHSRAPACLDRQRVVTPAAREDRQQGSQRQRSSAIVPGNICPAVGAARFQAAPPVSLAMN